jgi:hypothetical protein
LFGAHAIFDEIAVFDEIQDIRLGRRPIELLEVGRVELAERADDLVALAVVQLVLTGGDVVEDEARLVGVPGRHRRVQRTNRRIAAALRDGGDASNPRLEFGVGDRGELRRLGERRHRMRQLVLHHPVAEIARRRRDRGRAHVGARDGAEVGDGRGDAQVVRHASIATTAAPRARF